MPALAQPDSAATAPAVHRAPIRIVFVLTEFVIGGAEMMLWKLVSRMDRSRFEPIVVALSPRADSMLDHFVRSGVECRRVGMTPGLAAFAALLRLRAIFREFRPDIVQGWMYHGNLAATLAAALAPLRVPVVWNIRGAMIDKADQNRLASAVVWLSGRLSFAARHIINNSAASALEHEARLGYRPEKRLVVPNGFDTQTFLPSAAARLEVRQALGLAPHTTLVGLIGRYHPVKDHANFLRAASLLKSGHPHVQYVLAGEDIDSSNLELNRLVVQNDVAGCVHLLGLRTDMPAITASLDIAVSSSSVEGFPNVIGEAMSCGVPCVVTDVGDSAAVIGDTGRAVARRDSAALARGISELLEMDDNERVALGRRARQRIIDSYSLDSVVRRYEDFYLEVHTRSLNPGAA